MNTIPNAIAEEYRVERFFDLSTDMFLIAGFDGFFRKVNPAFERVMGYTSDELRTMRFTDLLHPDDLADTLRVVQEHGQTGDAVVRYECRFRCKDGSYRWLSFAATPPENGLIYSSCRDITEQKELIERLRRNEERYRQIVETTTEGIISIDDKGRITFVNRRTLEMFGYAQDEMIGQPITNFVQPEEAVREKLHELDMKKTHQNEVCFVRRDGSEFWALNNSSPILNADWSARPDFGCDRTAAAAARYAGAERIAPARQPRTCRRPP
jgi:PAS domain S-box-containing protein